MLDHETMPDHRLVEGIRAAIEELSTAGSPMVVADVLVHVAAAAPGTADAAVYLFDRTDGVLRQAATTVDQARNPALADALAPVAREAYLDGDPVVRGELLDDGDASSIVAAHPLGGYGALAVVSSDTGVDDRTRALVSSLATVSQCRLERIESGRTLRQRTRERDHCTERLARSDDVIDLVLGLERAVIAAESRSDLERIVCERLAALDRVVFAWIGRVDADEGRIVPAASAGRERGYLDAVDRTLTPSNSEPAVVAARERETSVADTVASRLRTASWRREALARDVQSVRAVPLVVDDRFVGVLAVYATDASVAADLWRRTLEHVAAVVAHGVGSLDRKRALLSDAVVELELQLVGGDDVFGRIARAVGADLRLDGVAARDDRLVLFLASSTCDEGSVESTIARDPAVVSVDPVRRDDENLLEVVVREEWLLSNFVDAGATPQSIEATVDGTCVVLTLPTDADVEGFVDSLERRYAEVTLRSRRERTRPVAREQYLWVKLEESLTDRQLETLRTAYLSGYFEWPRENSGEEVAELLDISQPTFSRHLRTAERKLLSLLFTSDRK